MAAMPNTGPTARIANAHCQPTRATAGGMIWIVAMVSRKPSEVCSVSAVPTACGGTLSVTSTENCAESAMTKKPHPRAIGTSSSRLAP